VKAFIIYAPCL